MKKPKIKVTTSWRGVPGSGRFKFCCSVPGTFIYGLGHTPAEAYNDWHSMTRSRREPELDYRHFDRHVQIR